MRARALLVAVAALLPVPAMAQHEGHAGHGQETTAPGAGEQRPAERIEQPAGGVHVGHAEDGPVDPAPAGREPDEHAGHVATEETPPPVSGPPTEALSGPENAADAVFGEAAMAPARRDMAAMHGDVPVYRVLIDRLEARIFEGRADSYLIDVQAWYGGDIDKLWIKAEGEGSFGEEFAGAEIQALWSHAIDPWFDLQAGIRYDLGPDADRGHLVLGVQGLAPYWIELEASAFLSDRGDVTARFEAEHDMRVTQRLILQPRLELDFALQDIPSERTGSGLATGSLGARLRYQITPRLAPYVGAEYTRTFGQTRRFRAGRNEQLGGVAFLAGVRAWF